VFRAELPEFGLTMPVVFSGAPGGGGTATRLVLDLMSFRRRPTAGNPRRWVNGAAAAGAVALAIHCGRRQARSGRNEGAGIRSAQAEWCSRA